MVSEKKANSKRLWFTSLLLPTLVFAIVGFVYFANKTNQVQAQAEGGSSVIYTNAPLATGATSKSGVAAPAGTQWSELQNDNGNTTESNTTLGTSCSLTATVFRCADNFTVPAGQTWTIDGVLVYAYQTSFTGTTSPIIAGTVRIWNGRPGDSGSTVVFGDTTTNRLGTSVDSLLWRIGNSLIPTPTTPVTNRRIWETTLNVSPALALGAGTYWIDWNTQIAASGAHFAPPATVVGARTQPGWNARQFNGTSWVDALDTGNPATAPDVAVDFPFKLSGTTGGGATTQTPNVDFDGDGKTDYSLVRDQSPALSGSKGTFGTKSIREKMQLKNSLPKANIENLGGAPPAGTDLTWYINNSSNSTASVVGLGDPLDDFVTPADFDGDGKADVAVWRGISSGQSSGNAYFYIFNSATSTLETVDFGQVGDNPTVVADYDGDGSADPAVFRCPTAGGQCFYYYIGSAGSGNTTFVPFGNGNGFNIFPNVGDFDGDGKADFCLQRENPSVANQGQFVLLRSTDGGSEFIQWGLANDLVVPGDFDGDGKSDFAVGRNQSGQRVWYVLERDGGVIYGVQFGLNSDFITPGDYDGDGKTDISVFRPDANPNNNLFYTLRSSDQGLSVFEFGIDGDYPLANWQVQ